MHDLTRWDGPAWRADSGFTHDRSSTVADVVRYEVEELGNDLPIYGDALKLYGHLPARKAVWVTAKRKDAARYGGFPERWMLHGIVVTTDGADGGFLVIVEN